ncbi:unnamed protein product [Musa banksii]
MCTTEDDKMRTVVKSRASLLLTLVIVVFLVTVARGETTPVKEAKAKITYGALRPNSQPVPSGRPYTRGCRNNVYCRPPSTP